MYLLRSLTAAVMVLLAIVCLPVALLLLIIAHTFGWVHFIKNPNYYYPDDLVEDYNDPKLRDKYKHLHKPKKGTVEQDHIRICPVCEKLMDATKCKDCQIETVLLEEWVDRQWNS